MPSSTARLYRGRVLRLTSDKFLLATTTRQSGDTMTSVSAGHIILTPTQPVESGRLQRESNPGPPQQESRALYDFNGQTFLEEKWAGEVF